MTMADRTEISALRSMKRAIGRTLPAPWDVQLRRAEPNKRPLCVVRFLGPTTSTGSAYVREFEKLCEIFAYPEGVEGDATRSELEARRISDTLLRALDTGNANAGTKALRVPFFDYSAVADDAVLPDNAAPFDYLVLSQVTVEVRNDPDADDLFTVMLNMRINWRADGDVSRFDGQTWQDIQIPQPTIP